MKYIALLLALSPLAHGTAPPSTAIPAAKTPLVSEPVPLGHNFTVNLLTRVKDMVVQTDLTGEDLPISFYNATIQHVYEDVLYSVVGSLVFDTIGAPQTYHIHTDLWEKEVNITVDAPTDAKHVDIALSKREPDGPGTLSVDVRFDWLTKGLPSLNVTNAVVGTTP